MTRQLCLFGLLAIATSLLSGCDEGLPPAPATLKVTGTVTYDGSPLEGASVIFSDDIQYSPIGKTDAAGRFTLKTRFSSEAEAEGAPPRNYRVTIKKLVPPGGMTEEQYAARKERVKVAREKGERLDPSDAVPRKVQLLKSKYSSATETVLEANVTLDGPKDFSFNLDK